MHGEKKREKMTQHSTQVEVRADASEESGRRSHISTVTTEIKKLSQRREAFFGALFLYFCILVHYLRTFCGSISGIKIV